MAWRWQRRRRRLFGGGVPWTVGNGSSLSCARGCSRMHGGGRPCYVLGGVRIRTGGEDRGGHSCDSFGAGERACACEPGCERDGQPTQRLRRFSEPPALLRVRSCLMIACATGLAFHLPVALSAAPPAPHSLTHEDGQGRRVERRVGEGRGITEGRQEQEMTRKKKTGHLRHPTSVERWRTPSQHKSPRRTHKTDGVARAVRSHDISP